MERNGVSYSKSAVPGLEYYDYPQSASRRAAASKSKAAATRSSEGERGVESLPVAVTKGKNVVLNVRGFLAGRQGWLFVDTFNSDTGEAIRISNIGEPSSSPSVIKGLEYGLLGDGGAGSDSMQAMRKGDKRRLIIPSSLGYENDRQAPQPLDEGAKRRLFSTVLNPVRSVREETAFNGDSIVGKLILDCEVVRISSPGAGAGAGAGRGS